MITDKYKDLEVDGATLVKYRGLCDDVQIPDGITDISRFAFEYCESLNSICIPKSVNHISEDVFINEGSLTSVYYDGTIADWCDIHFGNKYANPMSKANNFYLQNEDGSYTLLTGEVVIPDNVPLIRRYAFYAFDRLTSVTIGSSVNRIGRYAFAFCTSLRTLIIGNGDIAANTVSIGTSAFEHCVSLTDIYVYNNLSAPSSGNYPFRWSSNRNTTTNLIIGDNVTLIGDNVFNNFNNLNTVTIGNAVTTIGISTFRYCPSLKEVYYNGSIEGWCSIIFLDEWSNPVHYASNLSIKDLSGKYMSITNLEILGSISTLNSYVFYGLKPLASIIIPSNVTEIKESAFTLCNHIDGIYIENINISVDKHAFSMQNLKVFLNATEDEYLQNTALSSLEYIIPAFNCTKEMFDEYRKI